MSVEETSHEPAVTLELPIVQVKLLENLKTVFRNPHGIALERGDICAVESRDGETLAEVITRPWTTELESEKEKKPLFFKVLRKAEKTEIDSFFSDREFEARAGEVFKALYPEMGLKLKFVRVVFRKDPSKLTFFFVSEGRIDFRDLVRELAQELSVRIEMRQVGVRDEARMLGSVAKCGQETCCSRFLQDFAPVSMRMAKEQGLSLIPVKISGQCGRLLCCLNYENVHYMRARKEMPRMGKWVETPEGVGCVVGLDFVRMAVNVKLAEDTRMWFKYEDTERTKAPEEPLPATHIKKNLDFSGVLSKSAESTAPEKATSQIGTFLPSTPMPDSVDEEQEEEKDDRNKGRRRSKRRGGRGRRRDSDGSGQQAQEQRSQEGQAASSERERPGSSPQAGPDDTQDKARRGSRRRRDNRPRSEGQSTERQARESRESSKSDDDRQDGDNKGRSRRRRRRGGRGGRGRGGAEGSGSGSGSGGETS